MAEEQKPQTTPRQQEILDRKREIDVRSVYVGNVDYSATPQELEQVFNSAGVINRITLLCDKFTGLPKGYAYIEYEKEECVAKALELNGQDFKGRPLRVVNKRTNVPGLRVSKFKGPRRWRGPRPEGAQSGQTGDAQPETTQPGQADPKPESQ